MRFHVDMEAADLERLGVPPEEARRRAHATLGGMQRYTEEVREMQRGAWMTDLKQDLHYAVRSLLRARAYLVVVILTLALGIAANTSIFSVANGVLFRTLPYRDPSRLLWLWDDLRWAGLREAWLTGPEVVRLRAAVGSFEGVSAVRTSTAAIGGDRDAGAEQVAVSSVSANFFSVLGAGPDVGRAFARGDDAPGAPRVAVVSRRLFNQRFAGDRAALGQSLQIDGQPTAIVGVLPDDFLFALPANVGSPPTRVDVYVPLTDTLDRLPAGEHALRVLARIRSSVTPATAERELSALSRELDAELYQKRGFRFVPVIVQERMVREVRPALYALLGAVAMLVLIMSANLAVLALVRGARREQELSVRRAIGASQGRVLRQLLTETMLLALAGGSLGTLLGAWALRGLVAIAPPGLPRRGDIHVDMRVAIVTTMVAMLVGVAMALAPVIQLAGADLAAVLRERAPSRAGGSVRRSLLLGQLALSMMLLAGTGLLLNSFINVMHVDQHFTSDHVLLVDVSASPGKFADGRPVVELFDRYEAAIRALPGVESASITGAPPLSARASQTAVGFASSPTNTGVTEHDWVLADNAPIGPDYLRTLGIPLVAGRELTAGDADSATSEVAIIDDVLATRYFPNGSALGHVVTVGSQALTVVGVAKHVRLHNLEDAGRAQVWVPHGRVPLRFMTIVVRTSGDPALLMPDVRRAIRGVDADQAIASMRTMSAAVGAALAQRRLVLILVGAFAAAALLLVAMGIYGVVASSVTQRTRELGIRMALGATRGRVIADVLREPTRLVATGLTAGLIGTLIVGRAAGSLLFGVSVADPLTLASVSLVLLAVAGAAAYVPARRATRVDPMAALRQTS